MTRLAEPRDQLRRALAVKRPRKTELVLASDPSLSQGAIVEIVVEIFHDDPTEALVMFKRNQRELAVLLTTMEVGESKLLQSRSILSRHGSDPKCVFLR